MHYRSSVEFERSVLGHCSNGGHEIFQGESNFSKSIRELIEAPGPDYPDTRIGKSLFQMVREELLRNEASPNGLIFRSAVGTRADARHLTDAFFYLPSVDDFFVSIDLFNIDSENLIALEGVWSSLSKSLVYSRLDLQSDLFMHNRGLFAWTDEQGITGGAFVHSGLGRLTKGVAHIPNRAVCLPSIDFRRYSDRRRPENHFLLTPYNTETSNKRKEFAKMVANCFISVGGA